jgi:3-oxoacyl-(acyl-carrier-protein) synthase
VGIFHIANMSCSYTFTEKKCAPFFKYCHYLSVLPVLFVYTEPEISRLLSGTSGSECIIADVSDRFGSYGLVAVAIFKIVGTQLYVESLMMSCRVLNRGVEHKLLSSLAQILLKRTGSSEKEPPCVHVAWTKSNKNTPVLGFLEEVGAYLSADMADLKNKEEFTFVFPAKSLQALELRGISEWSAAAKTAASGDGAATAPSAAKPPSTVVVDTADKFKRRNAMLKDIAANLTDVQSIMAAIGGKPAMAVAVSVPHGERRQSVQPVKPRLDSFGQNCAKIVPCEADVRQAICEEAGNILGFAVLDIAQEKPLMDLGMSSLKSVRFFAALQSRFPTIAEDLPATVVFDYPSVSQISAFVVQKLASGSSVSENTTSSNSGNGPQFSPQENAGIIWDLVKSVAEDIVGKDLTGSEDSPLMDIGMNSLKSVRFFAALQSKYPQLAAELPATLSFDYPTLRLITQYLQSLLETVRAEEYNAVFAGTSQAETVSPVIAEDDNSVAVVSLACRFPGAVRNPLDLWNFLLSQKEARQVIPEDRWDITTAYPSDCGDEVKYMFPIENVASFDAQLFGISPAEAQGMDPQQRFILTVGYEALYRSQICGPGKTPKTSGLARFSNAKTGVYVGITNADWAYLCAEQPASHNSFTFSGRAGAIAAGRLSFSLGLKGPSVVLDSACSSSHLAMNAACQALQKKDCEHAVVIGCSLNLHPETYIQLQRAGQLSATGRCHTFDASADGYARGEGCGAVVLRRLSDALANEEKVLAVVKAVCVNQDGRSASLPAPNGPAQQNVIGKALEVAGLSPTDISCVETHGTGTSLGDAIEVNSLKEVFKGPRSTPLHLGAVKTSIGHLEAASGIAGFIKAVMVLQHNCAPANLNFATLNPHINTRNFDVDFGSQKVSPVRQPSEVMRVGVSSFGMGGTNSFAILECGPQYRHSDMSWLTETPEAANERIFQWKKPLPYRRRCGEGFGSEVVPSACAAMAPAEVDSAAFELVWEETCAQSVPGRKNNDEVILLLTSNNTIKQGIQIMSNMSDVRHFNINDVDLPQSYERVEAAVADCATENMCIMTVVTSGEEAVPATYKHLLILSKLLTDSGRQTSKHSTQLVVALSNTVHIPQTKNRDDADGTVSHYSYSLGGVWGFVRALRMEYPWVRLKCADLDRASYAQMASWDMVLNDENLDQESDLCIRNGAPYIVRLKEIPESPWKHPLEVAADRKGPSNGAYVVSGGTSGVGLVSTMVLLKAGPFDFFVLPAL